MSTILVTGGGGAAVPALIEHLKALGHRVLGADMDPYAAGLYVADKGLVIPPGASPDYLPAMQRICEAERVDVVVPLVDEELIPTLELERNRVIVLTPGRQFMETCLDKYRLIGALHAAGIDAPQTRLLGEGMGPLAFPVIAKPRRGRGSRDVRVVRSESDLRALAASTAYAPDQMLLQQRIEGTEFTVSVALWRDGAVQAVVPKEIIFKKGITRLAVTRRNAGIDTLCRRIQSGLKADGPFNVQLRVDATTGVPMPFEVNPRFSTTTSLTAAAGVDEVGGIVAQALGGRERLDNSSWREGLVLLRRTLDEFIDEREFRNRRVERGIAGDGGAQHEHL